MPLHMIKLLEDALAQSGRPILDARIGVLGYAYLENSDDTRNSPTRSLVARLYELGAQPVIHDPWIPEYDGDVFERIKGCDAVVLMVAHSQYRDLELGKLKSVLRCPILVDGRHVCDAAQAHQAGLKLYSMGVG